MFQSTPGLLAGRYAPRQANWAQEFMFQSTPGLLAGRYDGGGMADWLPNPVSIHARLISRAIPWPGWRNRA